MLKNNNILRIYKGLATVASEIGKVHVQVKQSLNKAFSITYTRHFVTPNGKGHLHKAPLRPTVHLQQVKW